MKTIISLISIIISLSLVKSTPHHRILPALSGGVNGGTNCVACTAIVGLTEQLAIVYNETIDVSLERLCGYLPDGLFRVTCKEAIKEFGPVIIAGYINSIISICHII